jgi:hypothetical protein
MSVAARKLEPLPEPRIFHATVLVTRAEQWWVEAESADEARELLASGHGHRAALGERIHCEVEAMLEESAS